MRAKLIRPDGCKPTAQIMCTASCILVALRVDRGVAVGCTKMAGIPTIQKTLVTDGWLVGGLSVVFGWRVGMVWALWDDVHAAENF